VARRARLARWLKAVCADPAFGSTYDTGSLLTEKNTHPSAQCGD
jgi:hypothetical protein